MKLLNRRSVFVSGLGFILIGNTSAQERQNSVDKMKPYIQVETLKDDAEMVRVYFSPECSFSKSYFPFFQNLKKTLPPTRRFQYNDVVNRRDGTSYALACAAVRRSFPEYMSNFVEASLIGVQERSLNIRSWAHIDSIGRAARLPKKVSELVMSQSSVLQDDVLDGIRRQGHYKITNTPSVAVAGTYVVNPEIVMGDMEMFSRLINGVISMTQ